MFTAQKSRVKLSFGLLMICIFEFTAFGADESSLESP